METRIIQTNDGWYIPQVLVDSQWHGISCKESGLFWKKLTGKPVTWFSWGNQVDFCKVSTLNKARNITNLFLRYYDPSSIVVVEKHGGKE